MQNNWVNNSITDQIPSLDSDPSSSSSDNEEEIRVYRRPSIVKLSLEAEVDLDYLSLEEPETEDLLKSITEPFSYETEDDPTTPLHSDDPSDHKHQTSTALEDLEKPVISAAESERLACEATDHQKSHDHLGKKKTDLEMNSEEELTHTEPETLIHRSSGEARPILELSLKPLENMDLDQILHSLKQEHTGHHEPINERGEPLTVQLFKYPDYSSGGAESYIMDQLETFCKKQESVKMISTSETSPTQRQHMNNPSIKRTPEELANTFHHTKEQLCQNNSDSPTVFIDLRITDHQTEPPAAVCNKSSCPDLLMQVPGRGKVGNTLPDVSERNRMLSGKCLLLQKLRESNRAKAETSIRRKTTPEDSAQEEKMSGICRREDLHSCRTPHPVKHLDKTTLPTDTGDEASVQIDNNTPS